MMPPRNQLKAICTSAPLKLSASFLDVPIEVNDESLQKDTFNLINFYVKTNT